jgi:hypothetical protein
MNSARSEDLAQEAGAALCEVKFPAALQIAAINKLLLRYNLVILAQALIKRGTLEFGVSYQSSGIRVLGRRTCIAQVQLGALH